MLKHIGRTLAIGVTFAALVTPAFARNSPTGTDPDPGPDPGVIHIVLSILGLA